MEPPPFMDGERQFHVYILSTLAYLVVSSYSGAFEMRFVSLVLHTFKVFFLFTGCTVLFYYGIMWVNEEYQNYHRYDEPEGTAIKVFGEITAEEPGMFDRLILFYLNGE